MRDSGEGTFFCVDAHTCGNPVRVVAGGAPVLRGDTMMARRADFLDRFDWIRTGLMFEPRGHDAMSGSILMPATRDDCDIGLLFIEVSGCLPMCGHGTIGTVTVALERNLVRPETPGTLALDTPAGRVVATYEMVNGRVRDVRITNVPSYLHQRDVAVAVPGLGRVVVDIAYGGNFYAIVEPQDTFRDMADHPVDWLVAQGNALRDAINRSLTVVHPLDPAISGVSHVMWTGAPTRAAADARNAVLYGKRAIDRSPCGTGTSARMAQRHARGRMGVGDSFVHESIIGSLFHGKVESTTDIAGHAAIVPSVMGSAYLTGFNTIMISADDPFAHGFQLA
ncbi:MAG: 4-hydroxyproline epimerase [Minwuia sp.]|nr:4-hydroxyproline epimerase [Minwuia sp.]